MITKKDQYENRSIDNSLRKKEKGGEEDKKK